MKIQILLVFSFLFTGSVKAQSKSSGKFLEDSLCYKIWLVDNKMGGYDGYEFRKNGELKLLNYDGFVGEKWWTKGDHLFVEIRSKKSGKVLKKDYEINKQTNDSLVLTHTALGQSFTDVYETLTNHDFTDKLLGHWDGRDGTYIQIVPKSSFQFQLVMPRGAEEIPDRAEGYLDDDNARIIFYPEQEGKEMTVFFEAGIETITIGGKPYSRKCLNR
ncbi:MAG: lipocalin family protein [Fluviicola sp.]